jgi:hypothetical protein
MKTFQDTICYKINKFIDAYEAEIRAGRIGSEANETVKMFHQMRMQAQKMEDGLRLRKEIMVANGLEDNYQKTKGNHKRPEPKLDNISDIDEPRPVNEMRFEVVISDNGKEVFRGSAFGGALCMAQHIEDVDEAGIINGESQVFTWGHAMTWLFALDQLNTRMEDKKLEVIAAMRGYLKNGMLTNPKEKKRLLSLMNGVLPPKAG